MLESLNTRSYLTLLGCVSPYQDDFGETLSTVHFVCEAKNIKATPQQNAVITEYQVRYGFVLVFVLKTMQMLIFSFSHSFLRTLEIKDTDQDLFAYTHFGTKNHLNIQKTTFCLIDSQSR